MKTLLISTQNPGKVEEYRSIFAHLHLNLLSLNDAGVSTQIEEDGASFTQNSLLKSYHGYEMTGIPCLADDSGLEVDALGGEPGIYSARYGGEHLTDGDRVNLVLQNLLHVPEELRIARFLCCISIVGLTSNPIVSLGSISGMITSSPVGDKGFGYDPIFFLPSLKKTIGELSTQEKNLLSHRGDAARKITQHIKRFEDMT